jgi:Carboxypeptidase regulatory-like domain
VEFSDGVEAMAKEMIMRIHCSLILLSAVLVCVFLAASAFGQATISFAQLSGTVLDTSGRAVVGASVTARDVGTNQTYKSSSNSSGFYFVPNLPPGQMTFLSKTRVLRNTFTPESP